MFRLIIASFVASLLWIGPAHADSWVSAGLEGGQHVAINLEGVPTAKTEPFLATLALVPGDWPANNHAYELVVARFDCGAHTRAIQARIAYSGRHDPRTTSVSAPVAVAASQDPAVARQLEIVCSSDGSMSLPKYGWLDPWVQSLRP